MVMGQIVATRAGPLFSSNTIVEVLAWADRSIVRFNLRFVLFRGFTLKPGGNTTTTWVAYLVTAWSEDSKSKWVGHDCIQVTV